MNALPQQQDPSDREASFWASLFMPWRFFAPLLRNRSLYLQFTRRAIHAEHKGSILGAAWMVLNPLLMMGIYTLVFSVIFEARYETAEGVEQSQWAYGLGLFLSLSIFQLFAEAISTAPQAIVSQPNLCKKVVFPLEILPASLLGVSFFRFVISLSIALIAIALSDISIGLSALWLPVILIPLAMVTLGVILAFSGLGVFARDLGTFAQFLNLAIMYSSAIFYSSELVQDKAPGIWNALRFNPLLHIIEEARNVVLWGEAIRWEALGYAYIFGFASFVLGYAIFAKLKHAFADVL